MEFVIGNFGALLPDKPCPKCQGQAEFVSTAEDDYLLRCSQCHTCTEHAHMRPEGAVKEWENEALSKNPYHIAADQKIEHYLSCNIKGAATRGIQKENLVAPEKDDFTFYIEAIAFVLEDKNLIVEPNEDILLYDFMPDDSEIPVERLKFRFIKAFYNEENILKMLEFSVNDNIILRLSADSKNDCIKGTFYSEARGEKYDTFWSQKNRRAN